MSTKFMLEQNNDFFKSLQNLRFLNILEVAQKFLVEVPEIIWWGARDYVVVVETNFSDQLKPKPRWTINELVQKTMKKS